MEKIIRLTESDLKRVIKKILNEDFLGEQSLKSAAKTITTTTGATIPNGSLSFNGKTVNLYSDVENKKFYAQAKIYGEVTKLNGNKIYISLNNKQASMSLFCTNPKKNEFTYFDNYTIKKVYNTPLSTQLRKVWCTVNTSGASVPKSDFASNTQQPTSNFA